MRLAEQAKALFLSLTHTHSLSISLPLSLSLSHTHARSHTHTLSHTHTISLTHTHTLTHSCRSDTIVPWPFKSNPVWRRALDPMGVDVGGDGPDSSPCFLTRGAGQFRHDSAVALQVHTLLQACEPDECHYRQVRHDRAVALHVLAAHGALVPRLQHPPVLTERQGERARERERERARKRERERDR